MKKPSNEDYIIKANIIHKNKYNYELVKYINAKTKIKIICPEHGMFEQTPDNHLHHGCVSCGKSKKHTKESFTLIANIIHNDKYNYELVYYTNNKTKVKIICPEHGIFEQIPSAHLRKNGCPYCANNQTKTLEKFINESNLIHDFKYQYDKVKYVNDIIKIEIICPKHGEFKQKPSHHLQGHGCRLCSESKGEEKITQWLVQNNIYNKREFKFPDCKNKKQLPFDFYLPDHNLCIEYDGRQHHEPIEYFGGINSLAKTQENDQIKTQYCIDNNIELLRISYKEIKQINDILSLHIKRNNE